MSILSKSVVKKDDVAARNVLDELFVITLEDGTLHRLNITGQKIWDMIDGSTTVAEIIDGIALTHDVDADTATKDIEEYINALADKGMVALTDES